MPLRRGDKRSTSALQVVQTKTARPILKISTEDHARNDVNLAQFRLVDLETFSQAGRYMKSYRVEKERTFLGPFYQEFTTKGTLGHQYREDREIVHEAFTAAPRGAAV